MTEAKSTCCGGSCGSQKTEIARLARAVNALMAAQSVRQRVQARDHGRRAFVTRYKRAADDYASRNPDFADAYKYLCQHRDGELAEIGYADPALRRKLWRLEEMAMVDRAFRDGVNPAERICGLAKRRGFGRSAEAPLDDESSAEPDSAALEALAAMPDEDFCANWDRVIRHEGA